VIDTKENVVAQTLSVDAAPSAIAGDYRKNVFYVANQGAGVITVLRAQAKTAEYQR